MTLPAWLYPTRRLHHVTTLDRPAVERRIAKLLEPDSELSQRNGHWRNRAPAGGLTGKRFVIGLAPHWDHWGIVLSGRIYEANGVVVVDGMFRPHGAEVALASLISGGLLLMLVVACVNGMTIPDSYPLAWKLAGMLGFLWLMVQIMWRLRRGVVRDIEEAIRKW